MSLYDALSTHQFDVALDLVDRDRILTVCVAHSRLYCGFGVVGSEVEGVGIMCGFLWR